MATVRQKEENQGITPPVNPAAEQSVLGAVLLRPAVMAEVADILTADDFYRQDHGRIFRAMLELYLKQEPVDLVTVSTLLRERGQLQEVGGPAFLSQLSEHVGIAANAGSLCAYRLGEIPGPEDSSEGLSNPTRKS